MSAATVAAAMILLSLTVWAEFQLPPANELDAPAAADAEPAAKAPEAEAEPTPATPNGAGVETSAEKQPAISGDLFPPDLLLPVPDGATDLLVDDPADLPSLVEEREFSLPSSSTLDLPDVSPLLVAMTIPVNKFEFEGNTAFSDEALAAVVEPFLVKKNLSSDDLQSARLALTQHYIRGGAAEEVDAADGAANVADGYINSGAVLPDQDPWANGGVVKFDIVEGKLTRIKVEWVKLDADGNAVPARRSLWDHYLIPRIRRGASDPLHMGDMREQLQRLQKNPNIRRINAELKPDANPGEGYLEVKVEPAKMLHAGVDFHNHRSPSVGSEQLEFWLEHTSLTRHSDRLSLRYGLFERGIEDGVVSDDSNFEIAYAVPVTRLDTLFEIGYDTKSYAVIEEPFTVLGIEGRTETWNTGIRQPLLRTEHDEITVGLHLERRHTETSLLEIPFSLTPGAIDGEIDLTALRLSQEWIHREIDYVFALRSIFSIGIDAFDPTDNGSERDGEFLTWLGQAQLVRRLTLPGTNYDFQGVARANLQLCNSPLLAPEQYSVGGANSVRGYRENQLVRDMGYQGSLELRLPVWQGKRGSQLSVVPFVDVGGGWNKVDDGIANAHQTIASAGIGLNARIRDRLDASIYWGHGFTDFDAPAGVENLQDQGVHFQVSWRAW